MTTSKAPVTTSVALVTSGLFSPVNWDVAIGWGRAPSDGVRNRSPERPPVVRLRGLAPQTEHRSGSRQGKGLRMFDI